MSVAKSIVFPRQIDKKIKRKIFKRDKYRCLQCGTRKNLTIDHILPRILGGTDAEDNLQTLCRYHNMAKGSFSVKDYRNSSGKLKSLNPYIGTFGMLKKNFL